MFLYSKWIIRFELDKEEMLDKNINMDDVHFSIENGYKDQISCVFSDYNSDKLIFRVRILDTQMKKIEGKKSLLQNEQMILDQSDEIYILKNIQENLLNNIILRGVKNISKVILRKIQDSVEFIDGNYENKESWVLDTVGSNLLDILGLDNIDTKNTFTNDIIETYNILGIEAARQTIYNEIADVIEFDGTYINYHHLALLCDRMCYSKNMISIFRHGINNDNIGPIAKASFEETPEMFLRAARHGEMDNMRGVSANVMCGQEGNFGTGSFQLTLDIKDLGKMKSKQLKEKKSIENMFGLQDIEDNDICNLENIKYKTNIATIKPENVGDDNDYEPGF
jgi:DNA-directed RNA polymerase II subunit RPB1